MEEGWKWLRLRAEHSKAAIWALFAKVQAHSRFKEFRDYSPATGANAVSFIDITVILPSELSLDMAANAIVTE